MFRNTAWNATFGMSILFCTIALLWFLWQWSFTWSAVRVTGKVVKMDRMPKVRSHDHFAPIVQFIVAETQETVEVNTKSYTYPSPFKEGDDIDLYYKRDNPQNVRIAKMTELYFWPLVMLGIAAFFLVVGFVSPNAKK